MSGAKNKSMVTSVKHADHWRERPERSSIWSIRFIAFVALRVGRPAARALLYPVCAYFLLFAPRALEGSRQFLGRVLGRKARLVESYRHFFAFASTVLDRVYFLNDRIEGFEVEVHLEPEVKALFFQPEGIVLLGAHLGSFEAVRTLGRLMVKRNVSMVMYEENARKLNSVLAAINPLRGQEIIGLGHCDSMLKVVERLDAGDLVGILADRSIRDEKQLRCPFLGSEAAFPLGPFRIAAMLKRPTVLMYGLYRGGSRYDVYFEKVPAFSEPTLARNKMIQEALQRYVERLEHYCRLDPFNWFNFYDFWK
ncbi:MAG: acyl-CoA synthetase [Burkholderiaceae bacterium]